MLSQREAATQWGVSRATLQRAIKAGKLSLTTDKTLDPAEMLRAFGEPSRPESRPTVPSETAQASTRLIQLETENVMLRELVKSKDENLTDMRAQVQRLTHDKGVTQSRPTWWPWGRK